MGQVAASFKGLAAVTYRGAVIITLGLNRLIRHLCVGISVNRYLASLGIYFPEIPPPRCLTYIYMKVKVNVTWLDTPLLFYEWGQILASYPGLPSQLFSQPWKKKRVVFFHGCKKGCEGRPGYEARELVCHQKPSFCQAQRGEDMQTQNLS